MFMEKQEVKAADVARVKQQKEVGVSFLFLSLSFLSSNRLLRGLLHCSPSEPDPGSYNHMCLHFLFFVRTFFSFSITLWALSHEPHDWALSYYQHLRARAKSDSDVTSLS